MDAHPHIAYLFSEYPAVPPALCDTEMQALEAAGFRLTVASLNVPNDCFLLQRPASLKAEILYAPPRALAEMIRHSAPQDESWRAMSHLAAEHARKYTVSVLPRGIERTAWLCARELRRRGVQHVHVRCPRALPAALYLKKAGLPFSFAVESVPSPGDLLSELMQEAEFVIAAGEATRALLAARVPDSGDKLYRMHQGIDVSRYRAALCGDAGTLRLICTSVHKEDDGLPLVLEAMAALSGTGVATELCITGDGAWQQSLEQHAARLSLSSRLRFCQNPGHEETKRLLAASDVFVHLDPDNGTALPPRIMEAMATGLPVVARAGPGVEELIVDGITGWLVAPDPKALAERLAILADDPALRAGAGHAGLERVQEVFSLERTARPLAAQFRKSIAGRFAPVVAPHAAGVLCLLDQWPAGSGDALLADELRFLGGQAGVDLLVARTGPGDSLTMPPDTMEFLPDAAVLESVWRQERDLSQRAAALRSVCSHTPGEEFFLAARRAVYLAVLRRSRGWAHVHALRASSTLWAWLLQHLTGITASAVIEPSHSHAPESLAELIPAFSFGSLSDRRVPGDLPDILHPAAPRRRFFGLLAAPNRSPVNPAAVWARWLSQARGTASHAEG